MATNKEHETIERFCEDMQKIVSCVTKEVCYTYTNSHGREVLAWSKDCIKLVRADGKALFIDIGQEIELVDDGKKASTKYYIYSLLDEEKKDLIGFHFHPDLTEDPVLYPHIHVYADADKRYAFFNLHKRHIPSGRVALEDVIEWILAELTVKPLRDDWKDVLNQSREKFKAIRTWS